MGGVFWKLLNMSMAAGWLILAVLILRLLLKRAPKWIICLLWGMVALRLVCPFSVESRFSLMPSAELIHLETIRSETAEDRAYYENIPTVDENLPIVGNMLNPVLIETFTYDEAESAAPLQIYSYAAGIIWLCGTLLLLLYAFGSWIRMRHMVKEAVCYKDNIYLCDAVSTPFILGVIRARIYLPSGLDKNDIANVILHEQAHLKRKDHWWKPLGYLLLTCYWFHPLCHAAYAVFCRDIEFACDEKVIRDMTLEEKKEYSRALLSCGRYGRMVMASPLAFGEISVKNRIKSVLHYRKPAVWFSILAVIICLAAALCFLTNPQDKNGDVSAAVGNNNDRSEMKIDEKGNGGEIKQPSERSNNETTGIADITGNNSRIEEELAAVAGISVINGNNGDILSYTREESNGVFQDLLQLYASLNDTAEAEEKEENLRIGYRYCMRLYDEAGSLIHTITPYKDGFVMDGVFYGYHGGDVYDRDSVALMNYIDLLFYPAKSMPFDQEAKMQEVLGLQLVLPENTDWIKNICYYYSDNAVEIQYYDAILEVDCTMSAVKNGTLKLPDIAYDSRLEERWEGWTSDNQWINITLQRSADGKNVLARWRYNDCEFTIQTTVSDKDVDINPVPKTAIYVIQNF